MESSCMGGQLGQFQNFHREKPFEKPEKNVRWLELPPTPPNKQTPPPHMNPHPPTPTQAHTNTRTTHSGFYFFSHLGSVGSWLSIWAGQLDFPRLDRVRQTVTGQIPKPEWGRMGGWRGPAVGLGGWAAEQTRRRSCCPAVHSWAVAHMSMSSRSTPAPGPPGHPGGGDHGPTGSLASTTASVHVPNPGGSGVELWRMAGEDAHPGR